MQLFFVGQLKAQSFPNPVTLSTGQGLPNTIDPIWQASPWYTGFPPNPMGLPYISTLINNNCAPGFWVDPASLPFPVNNGNWITGSDDDCATSVTSGYRYFRLTLDLPADCNGFSVTVAGNYVLDLVGYADNTITDVFINGNSTGISGGNFAPGGELNIHLVGPWVVGINYVDVLVFNFPQPGGGVNPYGLLLVADATSSAGLDTDNDGVSNLNDLCPCEAGNNPVGCLDPVTNGCDLPAIRSAFAAAGCVELFGCANSCSIYFLNPLSLSGSQAQAFAQSLGANLISVQSAAENQCVLDKINDLGYTGVIWIGFNDEVSEGTFEWYDQSPVTYTNWAPGEPNQSGNEDCVQIYPNGPYPGTWNDLSCSSTDAKSIIEVSLCPIVNAGPDETICLGNTANLNASNTLFGSPPYTYIWDNGVNVQSNPVSPAIQTNYNVETIDRYSCIGTDDLLVNVNPLPPVNAGIDQDVCINDPVTLSASGAVTYVWDNSVIDGVAFIPAATTTYTVTGTDANGCVNTDQVTVIVYPLPAINAGPDQTICINDPVTLSGSGGLSYLWNNSVTDGVAFNPTTTATYTVTGTDSRGCVNTDQVLVTVNPLPTIVAGADQTICINDPVILSGAGGVSYSWDDSVLDGIAFNPTTTATYTVTGTDANGCVNTDQLTVIVNPLPIVNAGIDQAICPNAPVTLSGTGAASYVWDNSVSDGIAFNPAITTTYTVTGIDLNGCVNTDQVIVTVNSLPAVNAGVDQAICINDPVTLSGSGAVTYVWDNSVINGTAFNPSATATYTVTGTDANGCVNTDQVVVTVNPLPVVSFVASDMYGCIPMNITFTSTGNHANCEWQFGDGTTSSGCGSVTHTYTSSGCFSPTMTATSVDGCVNQLTINDIVCIPPNPVADFTTSAEYKPLNMIEATIDMFNSSSNASTYLWNFGNGETSTLVSPSYVYPNDFPGAYMLCLVAYNTLDCSDTMCKRIVVEESLLYFIPNAFTPDGNEFNQTFKPVFTAGFDPMEFNLFIYDRWGEMIFETHDAKMGWDGTYISREGLVPDGVYIWKIDLKLWDSSERKIEIGHVTLIR